MILDIYLAGGETMVSRKKFAGFDLVIGESGEIRFKKKSSEYNRYIAEMLRGRKKVSTEEFTRIARAYHKPEEEVKIQEEIEPRFDATLEDVGRIMEDWNIFKLTEPKDKLFRIKGQTIEKLRYVVC